ncbi:hypothetical protein EVJ58_g579 [Rhodofomes roseus]|uniref:CREG-like beta-barrel domain-containing protein n=1 Tax=Rhodofomes roseus TaxID=34475 RepID=A0A4Y9Z708_9APHY|nr:hypothetical protein EVJ58_g579 [Rhodofomes roseus]
MATMFPDDHATLAGQPFSLQEYYASCHANGSLVLLFMPISRASQNVLHSETRSVSISVMDAHPDASRPRVSLIGNVTVFTDVDAIPDEEAMKACYVAKHPDARRWVPGPREPHVAFWARFDPQTIYYVGGFGGLHYIGYIPLEIYQEAKPSGVRDWFRQATDSQNPSLVAQSEMDV